MNNLDEYIKRLERRECFGVVGAGNMGRTIVAMLAASGIDEVIV